jgi:thiol:disulfide interchange protein
MTDNKKTALEQLKCIPEKTEENGKTYVRGMLVDSILELDSRLRLIEQSFKLQGEVNKELTKIEQAKSVMATNETSPTEVRVGENTYMYRKTTPTEIELPDDTFDRLILEADEKTEIEHEGGYCEQVSFRVGSTIFRRKTK